MIELHRLMSTFMGGLLLRRFNRRPLLVISSLFVALGMGLLGASSYLTSNAPETVDTHLLDFLPLIGVNIAAVSYQLGLGPIGWAYISELYPVDLRAPLAGFSSMAINFFIFLVVKTFPTLKASALEVWGTYWLYAGVAVCAALFGATVLPETKGKTLAEVSEHFYVCCSSYQEVKEDEIEFEYKAFSADRRDSVTHKNNNVLEYRYSDKARDILKEHKTSKEEQIERRYKRRSLELSEKERSLKRRTLELSMLEEVIQLKVNELINQEEKLKRMSAPIVQMDELEHLLTES